MTEKKKGIFRGVNPHQKEIIELWHKTPEPKPSYRDFTLLVKDAGWSVNIDTLKQWRKKGYLPGEMVTRSKNPNAGYSITAKVNEIKVKALKDADRAAREATVLSHESIRLVAAKTIRCAEAMVERLTAEAPKVQVEKMTDLNVLAVMTMDVLKTVSAVTKELSLLVGTELAMEDVRADPVGLDEDVESLARKMTGR